jgi:hypothetical protein
MDLDTYLLKDSHREATQRRIRQECKSIKAIANQIMKAVNHGKPVDGSTINNLGAVAITLGHDVGVHNEGVGE